MIEGEFVVRFVVTGNLKGVGDIRNAVEEAILGCIKRYNKVEIGGRKVEIQMQVDDDVDMDMDIF